jgi:pimeloyl-ACP methyl ester carboxylesterase
VLGKLALNDKTVWGETMQADWRVAVTAAIFCTGVWLTCVETNAQSIPKEMAARVEIYAIPSLTISDQQFLSGDKNGKEVTVAGEFRVAQGSGKLPVVVLMHGSSGVSSTTEAWVHQFNAMGISTFVIDGFSGRGLTAVGPNQALLGRLNFIVDIYRSLEILAHHPRVDPERIVLMGFSRGGQAALYASLERFNNGTSPAFSSPATFHSIRIARLPTPPIPRSHPARSGSITARPTIITRWRPARPI